MVDKAVPTYGMAQDIQRLVAEWKAGMLGGANAPRPRQTIEPTPQRWLAAKNVTSGNEEIPAYGVVEVVGAAGHGDTQCVLSVQKVDTSEPTGIIAFNSARPIPAWTGTPSQIGVVTFDTPTWVAVDPDESTYPAAVGEMYGVGLGNFYLEDLHALPATPGYSGTFVCLSAEHLSSSVTAILVDRVPSPAYASTTMSFSLSSSPEYASLSGSPTHHLVDVDRSANRVTFLRPGRYEIVAVIPATLSASTSSSIDADLRITINGGTSSIAVGGWANLSIGTGSVSSKWSMVARAIKSIAVDDYIQPYMVWSGGGSIVTDNGLLTVHRW